MKFKGTKGKWIIKDRVASIQSENTGESITCWNGVAVSNYSLKEIEYKANSLLISKAPELLNDSLQDLELFDYLLKSLPLGSYHLTAFIKQRKQEKTELIKKATTI